jgi:hypothetical protein
VPPIQVWITAVRPPTLVLVDTRAKGTLSTSARKDIWLWQDGPVWTIGARHGDADGEVWRKSFDRESAARALVDRMMERNGGHKAWLDLTSLVHDSPR